MTQAPSQTAGTILTLLLVAAGIGAVLALVRPAAAPQGALEEGPETEAGDLTTFGDEPDSALSELLDADAAADVEPRELDWVAGLPHATSFRQQKLASLPVGEPVKLLWRMTDHGPAPEGNREHRYRLEISWTGVEITVPLEPSYGWPEAELASACGRRDADSPGLPELAVFAEGNFRGYEMYRVLVTPHAIHVIEQDTSPGDWIHDCHEVHQGPFTECKEMSWSLAATVVVDLPPRVRAQEQVITVVPDGTYGMNCDVPAQPAPQLRR